MEIGSCDREPVISSLSWLVKGDYTFIWPLIQRPMFWGERPYFYNERTKHPFFLDYFLFLSESHTSTRSCRLVCILSSHHLLYFPIGLCYLVVLTYLWTTWILIIIILWLLIFCSYQPAYFYFIIYRYHLMPVSAGWITLILIARTPEFHFSKENYMHVDLRFSKV